MKRVDTPKARGETFQDGVNNKAKASIETCEEKSTVEWTI